MANVGKVVKDVAFAKTLFGIESIRTWKGVSKIHDIIDDLMKADIVKPGMVITTAQLEQLIKNEGIMSHWNLDPSAQDPHGLRRTLGDAIGGHGLGLRKSGGGYIVPESLPEVDGDSVTKEAVY